MDQPENLLDQIRAIVDTQPLPFNFHHEMKNVVLLYHHINGPDLYGSSTHRIKMRM